MYICKKNILNMVLKKGKTSCNRKKNVLYLRILVRALNIKELHYIYKYTLLTL